MTILGVKISNLAKRETLEEVESFLFDSRQHFIATSNPEMIVLAQRDGEFKKVLNETDLSVADGSGLIFASRILKEPLKERISGVDLIVDILKMAERNLLRVYFLGGFPKIAAEMSLKLKSRFPELKIGGANDGGKIGLDGIGESDGEILKIINEARPDILFVAFGHGKQEKWIARNLKKMPSIKIAMGVGGTFDFLSGRIRRAPLILRKLNLEWLWRLILEPKRIKRIFNATIVFPFLILKYLLKKSQP